MENQKPQETLELKRLILLSLIFWVIWGAFLGIIIYLGQISLGIKIAFITTIASNIIGWSFWGLVTPIILYLRKKIRFKKNITLALLYHTALSFIFGLTRQVYFGFFQSVIGFNFSNETFQQHIDWYLAPQRILINGAVMGVVYWLILGGGYIYEYYQESMEKKFQNLQLEQQLSKAKLTALQYQLQPHFLFNTLHSISSLILKKENQTAISMIAELSDLLRYSLKSAQSYEIKLQNELELLNKYLDIIKIRFANKISIKQDIQEVTLDALIPNFILQPLIENAVLHGVEEKADSGVILISSKQIDDMLEIVISDNGKGFDVENSDPENKRVGLLNTQQRLETLYKDKYQFIIDSQKDVGTKIKLFIPFHVEPINLA